MTKNQLKRLRAQEHNERYVDKHKKGANCVRKPAKAAHARMSKEATAHLVLAATLMSLTPYGEAQR